jgi:hypothetical protein
MSGFADRGQRAKDHKHGRFNHKDAAHGIACSVGSLSEDSAAAINYLYARDSGRHRRNWDSEPARIPHKNTLLDALACVLARHRTLDYEFIGYPNRAKGVIELNNHMPLERSTDNHQNEEINGTEERQLGHLSTLTRPMESESEW